MKLLEQMVEMQIYLSIPLPRKSSQNSHVDVINKNTDFASDKLEGFGGTLVGRILTNWGNILKDYQRFL